MNTFRYLSIAALIALVISLHGCGGGTQTAEGGIGGSGISSGSVTGFGSIIVNGVEFDTDNAEFSKDGDTAATQDDLAVGMVVTVQGTINADGLTGTADQVTYLDILEGPVESVGATSFVALGQTIAVDGATKYSGGLSALGDIRVGDVVEVSGFFTAKDNVIHATYIERTNDTEHEIKGVVSSIDSDNNQFNIGELVVKSVDASMLTVGDFVKVEGNFMTGELFASEVDVLNKGLELEDADDAELEGLATTACSAATAPCTFNIGFITVQVTTATEFEGGALLANIQPGVRLEVEGELVNGIITAEEIEFEDSIELESDVVSIGVDSLTLYFGDSEVVSVKVDESTEFEGFGSFADVEAGDHVSIRGRQANGDIKAARIEDQSDDPDVVELQAPIEAEVGEILTILGIDFDLRTLDSLSYEDDNDQSVSRTQFLEAVVPGDIVSLQGEFVAGGAINWLTLEIED